LGEPLQALIRDFLEKLVRMAQVGRLDALGQRVPVELQVDHGIVGAEQLEDLLLLLRHDADQGHVAVTVARAEARVDRHVHVRLPRRGVDRGPLAPQPDHALLILMA
jgi:hypothetical protein